MEAPIYGLLTGLIETRWVEWTKGICHAWPRGRLIPPSLPVGDDGYRKLSSQKSGVSRGYPCPRSTPSWIKVRHLVGFRLNERRCRPTRISRCTAARRTPTILSQNLEPLADGGRTMGSGRDPSAPPGGSFTLEGRIPTRVSQQSRVGTIEDLLQDVRPERSDGVWQSRKECPVEWHPGTVARDALQKGRPELDLQWSLEWDRGGGQVGCNRESDAFEDEQSRFHPSSLERHQDGR